MNININPLGVGGQPQIEHSESSSLDRFIWEKGMKILSYNSKGAIFGLSISASINGFLGLLFVGLSVANAGKAQLAGPGVIILATAIVLGTLALIQYRRSKQTGSEVQLNADAVRLISQLATHIG